MSDKRINFIFLRHGNACHNVLKNIMISNKNLIKDELKDAVLTHYGVDTSIWIGCLIKNILKILNQLDSNYQDIESFDYIGASPLLRSMETAYFMSNKWEQRPEEIFIFPYLRELDERIFSLKTITKYSDPFIYNNVPQYSMKTINEQKEYLKNNFPDMNFNFSFVEKDTTARERPGDVELFINWFYDEFKNKLNKNIYNILIITHAGVIKEYFNETVYNNFGFILPVTIDKKENINLQKHLSLDIEECFTQDILEYLSYKTENICGNDQTRCIKLCSDYNNKTNKPLKKIKLTKCKELDKIDIVINTDINETMPLLNDYS